MPYFIRTEAPPILTGLLVAAVFAAAMSSLDSALNSLATAFVVDFYSRLSKNEIEDHMKLKVARIAVIVGGLIANLYWNLCI